MIISMSSLRHTISENFKRLVDTHPEFKPLDITEAAEVSPGMYYKWYSGDNIPDPDKVEALARLFRVDPVEFYQSEDKVIPIYGNTILRKYLVIPDDIIEELAHLNPGHESLIWKNIRFAIEEEKMDRAKKRAEKDKQA